MRGSDLRPIRRATLPRGRGAGQGRGIRRPLAPRTAPRPRGVRAARGKRRSDTGCDAARPRDSKCLPRRGGPWILVDTGTPGNAEKIRAAAQERIGAEARPEAIVLTHGHADHAGSAAEPSGSWGVPVYAHRLELPFLTSQSAYPPPDPTVGGPSALLSRFMPRRIVHLGGERANELPVGGVVPGMPGWRWIHTPGHTPGHVCLFRPEGRVLLAG